MAQNRFAQRLELLDKATAALREAATACLDPADDNEEITTDNFLVDACGNLATAGDALKWATREYVVARKASP